MCCAVELKGYKCPLLIFSFMFIGDDTRSTSSRMVDEEVVIREVPPRVEQVPQDGQGVQGAQVPPQDDHVPIVEVGDEVLVVHPKLTNTEKLCML